MTRLLTLFMGCLLAGCCPPQLKPAERPLAFTATIAAHYPVDRAEVILGSGERLWLEGVTAPLAVGTRVYVQASYQENTIWVSSIQVLRHP